MKEKPLLPEEELAMQLVATAKAAGKYVDNIDPIRVAAFITDEYAWSNTSAGKKMARRVNRRANTPSRQTGDKT